MDAACPFLGHIHRDQIEHFQQGFIGRKNTFPLGHLSQLPVVALDYVRGVDEFANFRWVLEEGQELLPVVAPRTDNERIFGSPDFFEAIQFKQCSFFGCGFVNRLQVSGHFLEVLVRHIACGIMNLVNDTLLNLSLRIACSNGFRKATQIVYTNNRDVLHAVISQIIKYVEPKLAGFILANPHAQHTLVSIQVNAYHHVGGLVYIGSILLHFEVNRIHVYEA